MDVLLLHLRHVEDGNAHPVGDRSEPSEVDVRGDLGTLGDVGVPALQVRVLKEDAPEIVAETSPGHLGCV